MARRGRGFRGRGPARLRFFPQCARCDEGLLPGHSHYGEAFDRGPRHSAYLMGGTGKIHFPVSSNDPLVQKFVEQGIGQLHGFWFAEAERSFREAARIDPNCGIAYWGMAVANQSLNPVSSPAVCRSRRRATRRAFPIASGCISRRSTMTAGYQALIAKYPDDLEAKAFEVWRLWHAARTQRELRRAAQNGPSTDRAKSFAPNHCIRFIMP